MRGEILPEKEEVAPPAKPEQQEIHAEEDKASSNEEE